MKLRWYNKNYVGTHFGGSMNTESGEKCHLRVTTQANVEQQKIFDALGIKSDILARKKTITDKNKICSAN